MAEKWSIVRWHMVLEACLNQADCGVPVFFHSRIDGLLLGNS